MNLYKNTINLGLGKKNCILIFFSFIYYFKFKSYNNRKKILYMLTPNYGNLGDQAIAEATNRYLNDNFKEYQVIEIERDLIFKYYKAIKNIINQDDFIVLQGGGNMGNRYMQEERARRFVIQNFNSNKIVSMTQTISFTNDRQGEEELKNTADIYNKNINLTIIAREDKSYQNMKKVFNKASVIQIPDIVLYLENLKDCNLNERKYIMTCLRNDKESVFLEKRDSFIENLKESYNNIYTTDTVINDAVNNKNRMMYLEKIWCEFFQAKVVITDRLHGMIFCAITKTPCIVIRSLDYKIVESYKWLRHLNYIKLIYDLDINKIKPIIEELTDLEYISKTTFKKDHFDYLRSKLDMNIM